MRFRWRERHNALHDVQRHLVRLVSVEVVEIGFRTRDDRNVEVFANYVRLRSRIVRNDVHVEAASVDDKAVFEVSNDGRARHRDERAKMVVNNQPMRSVTSSPAYMIPIGMTEIQP